jgi:hypothetical protein
VKCFGANGGTHDVNDGVNGAYFVEVNGLDAYVVNLGFGFAEGLEHREGALFRAGRYLSAADNGTDLFQSTMRVGISALVPVLVLVDAFGSVVLVFGVGNDAGFVAAGMRGIVMSMRMGVLMRVIVRMGGAVRVRVFV